MPIKDIKAYRAASYQQNKQKRNAQSKAWAKLNPEKVKISRDAYLQRNKEKTKNQQAAYRERNREKINDKLRRWRAKNKEKTLFVGCQRRARDKGLEFNLEISDIVIPEVCPVFNVPLGPSGPYGPSVDRIDNDAGYVKGNILVVSWRANHIKNSASMAEIQALASFYAKYTL